MIRIKVVPGRVIHIVMHNVAKQLFNPSREKHVALVGAPLVVAPLKEE